MIKNTFQKEMKISGPQGRGLATTNKRDTIKVQSWLNLFARFNPTSGTSTGIDGDFGPATERAVNNFQKAKKLPVTGVVNDKVFAVLCDPLTRAFTSPLAGSNLRALVLQAAKLHLQNRAFELVIDGRTNTGPWVRSYMDGNEGTEWFWCMGFVQTVIDQAASHIGKNFKTLMPLTYSCDAVGTTGLQKNILTRYDKIRSNPALAKPGDIFLVQKTPNDWIHTGIITGIQNEVFETIEGNTNTDGSSNGDGVYLRTRNFMKSKIDVFSIESLVK